MIELALTSSTALAATCVVVMLTMVSQLRKSSSANTDTTKAESQFEAAVAGPDDEPDVIIIGAGVAGAAMATVLARDGRKVALIERDMSEPHRIVGELLQPGGCQALKTLGLLDDIDWKGIDAVVERGYIVHQGLASQVTLSYPSEQNLADNSGVLQGQHTGYSFHHGPFIMELRRVAQAEPNVRIINGTVVGLESHSKDASRVSGVSYRERESGETRTVHAPLTIVADGCFSKFRKTLVRTAPTVRSNFVGLVLRDVDMFRSNYAEVVLTNPSPVLVYQIGTHDTRILVDVANPLPKTSNGDLERHLRSHVAPQLPLHLRGPFERALDNIEQEPLRSMPNSFLPPAPLVRRGVVLLGDALNMRHPLTGGGMTVAFNDLVLWRARLRAIPDLRSPSAPAAVTAASHAIHTVRRDNHSFVVNVLAQALYELFSASSPNLSELRDACFEYFQRGGECVAGPVQLLSALRPAPSTLIFHFFSVAFVAVARQFRSRNPFSATIRSVAVLGTACRVIAPLIVSETWRSK